MNSYLTFLSLLSIIIWPVSFVVAFFVSLTQAKRFYYEIIMGAKLISKINTIEDRVAAEKKDCRFKVIIAVISIVLSITITLLIMV